MKRSLIVMAMFAALSVQSYASERVLTGVEMKNFLPTIRARGSNTSQTFDADGNTDYSSGGSESMGIWRVEGDKYCSTWPPLNSWACYGVVIDEDAKLLFWVDQNGAREQNRFISRR